MASYGQHLQNVDNMANVVRKAGLSPDDLPIRFGPSNVATRQRSLDELQSTGSPVEDAAQRLSLRLTQGVEEIRVPKDLTDSLLSKIPIVGRLAEKAKDHPLGSLFLLSSIVDGGLGIGAGAVAAGAAVVAGAKGIKQLYKEPGRGLGMSVLTAEGLSRLGMDDQDPEDFDGVVKRIRATPPEIISQSVTRDLTPAADKIGDDAILKASQAAANRWNALQRRVDTIFSKQSAAQRLVVDKATPKQRRQLTKAISIASDPNAFARLWAKDKLDRDDLKFAEQIWPKHVMEAKSQAINWLDKNGTKTIPRSIRRRLELLLGSDAVEARKDMSALAAQSIIATANARRAQAKQNPPAGSSGIDGRTVARESMSPSQAISSRPSD